MLDFIILSILSFSYLSYLDIKYRKIENTKLGIVFLLSLPFIIPYLFQNQIIERVFVLLFNLFLCYLLGLYNYGIGAWGASDSKALLLLPFVFPYTIILDYPHKSFFVPSIFVISNILILIFLLTWVIIKLFGDDQPNTSSIPGVTLISFALFSYILLIIFFSISGDVSYLGISIL